MFFKQYEFFNFFNLQCQPQKFELPDKRQLWKTESQIQNLCKIFSFKLANKTKTCLTASVLGRLNSLNKILISFYLFRNWLTKLNNIANDQSLNTFNISQQTTCCTNDSRSRRVYREAASRRIPRGRTSHIRGPWKVLCRSERQI